MAGPGGVAVCSFTNVHTVVKKLSSFALRISYLLLLNEQHVLHAIEFLLDFLRGDAQCSSKRRGDHFQLGILKVAVTVAHVFASSKLKSQNEGL